jgi:hypothetical protein
MADGRDWVFFTQSPSYADISMHFILAWLSHLPAAKPLNELRNFPKVAEVSGRRTKLPP